MTGMARDSSPAGSLNATVSYCAIRAQSGTGVRTPPARPAVRARARESAREAGDVVRVDLALRARAAGQRQRRVREALEVGPVLAQDGQRLRAVHRPAVPRHDVLGLFDPR